MTTTIDYRQVNNRPSACEYSGAVAITPADGADLSDGSGTNVIYPALKIGATGGALKVTTAMGHVVTLNVAANEVLKLAVKRVWATGTVATTIHGLIP